GPTRRGCHPRRPDDRASVRRSPVPARNDDPAGAARWRAAAERAAVLAARGAAVVGPSKRRPTRPRRQAPRPRRIRRAARDRRATWPGLAHAAAARPPAGRRRWHARVHGRRAPAHDARSPARSEEHTSELQSRENLVCRLLLEKKKTRSRGGGAGWRSDEPTTAREARARHRFRL